MGNTRTQGCECVCVRVGHLGGWGELVNHKRSFNPLSHISRLGTQVSYSFCVFMLYLGFLSSLPLGGLPLASVLYTCIFVHVLSGLLRR